MKAPLLVALTVLIGANAWAAPPKKNQYILVKNRYLLQQPNASAPAPIKDAVTHGGGHVDYEGWDRLIVTLPDNAVEAIAKHVGTKYLQLIRSGPPSTGANSMSQANSTARAITNSVRPPVNPAHVDNESLRAVANSTSTWDSGTYAYDGAGNITSIGNDTFTYDSLFRLSTSSTKGNVETYTYDAYGNLTLKTTTPAGGTTLTVDLTTDTATNQLHAQTYDTAGNLTGTASTETNVYDPFNMMRRKNVSGYGSEFYIYNTNDERIAVISGCTTAATPDCSGALITVSGRDEAGKVLRQFDVPYPEFATQGWRWLEDYVYRDNALLASEREAAEGGRRHFHLDHLGSPRLVTGAGGVRIAAHDYYPFGVEITSMRQETLAGFDREEPMKFTGQMRDFNIGVLTENSNYNDYMHARSTVAQWGRFLSVDPLVGRPNQPQSLNRYSYVRNNPVKNLDPDGRDVWVASEMQAAVSFGNMFSPSFRAQYLQFRDDPRVYWLIKGEAQAASGTRAHSKPLELQRDAQGHVTHAGEVSYIPRFVGVHEQAKLIGHEGRHLGEEIDTGRTIQDRYLSHDNGVFLNSAAGENNYESRQVLAFERLVADELLRSDAMLPVSRRVVINMLDLTPAGK